MKNYVVGDIQGCYSGLRQVLKKAKFNPNKDKLWAVGDLIARGPESYETTKYLSDLGEHFDTVLGNHDLHLMAIAHGIAKPKPQDKLEKLIKHKNFSSYIDFLLQKPLALSPAANTLITHAGLYPAWSHKKTLKLSYEIQEELQSGNPKKFLTSMYGSMPNRWDKSLKAENRYRFIVNACTRMRYVHSDNSLDFATKCHPQNAPSGLLPWFLAKNEKAKAKETIIFGHWASLMGKLPKTIGIPSTVIPLDTGFVWGNVMSLYCIESQKIIRHQA
jgi:bis(5'-nucleosyl)-tetraphosphatase (symmetrical)